MRPAVAASAQKIETAAWLAITVIEIKVSVANGFLKPEKTRVNDRNVIAEIIRFRDTSRRSSDRLPVTLVDSIAGVVRVKPRFGWIKSDDDWNFKKFRVLSGKACNVCTAIGKKMISFSSFFFRNLPQRVANEVYVFRRNVIVPKHKFNEFGNNFANVFD